MLEKLGGRKFVFAILVILLGFVLVLTKVATSDQWMKFVEVVGSSYIIGNVVTKFSTEARK
jgi:hypothetical protein